MARFQAARQLQQQTVAAAMDHRCFCSKFTAKSRLRVEHPSRSVGRIPVLCVKPAVLPSAIHASFVQPQSVPGRAMAQSVQYEYDNL
jgi:hypothetical protein